MRMFRLAFRLFLVPSLLLSAGVTAQGRAPASDVRQPDGSRTAPSTGARTDGSRTAPSTGARTDGGRTAPSTGARTDGGRTAPAGEPRPDTGHRPADGDKTRPDTGHFPPGTRDGQPGAPAKAVKLKPSLVCTTVAMSGKPLRLPALKVRLEQPIQCVLSAGPKTGGMALTGTFRTRVGGKARKSHEGPLTGAGEAVMKQELQSDDDFETCMNFTIEAEIRDQGGKVVGKKSIKIKQFCPD